MSLEILALLCAFAAVALWYIWRWFMIERRRRRGGVSASSTPGATTSTQSQPSPASSHPSSGPRLSDAFVGFITNFFDTLGIGSFAPTTAIFKLLRRMPDEQIPGTLNAGHALPTIVQALIFVAVVSVDVTTLVSMIAAAVFGAWLGVGIVARLPRRAIQLGMGVALFIAAMLFLATNLGLMPGGGEATGLSGATLIFAVVTNFLLGALMMLGLGLYAPCLVLVSLLGMSPLAGFPIMMGSCALLMPIGGARFVASGRYNFGAALGIALGGIPGVLIAAFVVKSLPIVWLRWLVVIVVLYAATQMLMSARRPAPVGAAP